MLFVNNVNTMQFDALIAGGCSKHHMALIPFFPVTVSWTMYEKTSNQNKDFLIWKDKQPNVRVQKKTTLVLGEIGYSSRNAQKDSST